MRLSESTSTMPSLSQQHEQTTDGLESKSEARTNMQDVPPGEAIGYRSEDLDLSQFGYKAELEVRHHNHEVSQRD